MALAIQQLADYFAILDHRRKHTLKIEGIVDGAYSYTRGRAEISLASMINPSFTIPVEFHIVDSITSVTPVAPVADHCWQHLSDLPLADPKFGEPGHIQALLGSDAWGQVISDGVTRGNRNDPIAQCTQLGWVVFGPAESTSSTDISVKSFSIQMASEDASVDQLLRTLFEVELEDPQPGMKTTAIDPCEEIFKTTFKRSRDGRYSVQIPFRPDAPALGNSHRLALRQFLQLEKKLASDPDLRQKYLDFMLEYEQLGHMYHVPDQQDEPAQAYYIPHHAVTTKFRVVFNASAKTSNGYSLNDTQYAGRPMQGLLIQMLHRFRLYAIALTADVEKMFRQVRIDKRHRRWQQILWRDTPTQPIRTYQLATVTYGTTSGPYLAVRSMQQCGLDNCHQLTDPERILAARTSILQDFYVDDYLTSVKTVGEAIQLATDVSSVLAGGHFHLRKWRSNSREVLAHIIGTSKAFPLDLHLGETTVLGLHWDPSTDELFYRVSLSGDTYITKRQALSDAAKLYDPTGMLAPVLLLAKLFIQRMWQAKLDWDNPLPSELLHEWLVFRNQLSQLEAIRIPRWLGVQDPLEAHLYGFCDASTKAYAAVIYLCTKPSHGRCNNQLITSKTRVAPMHPVTIPRLELCAAQLLTTLMKETQNTLQLKGVTYTMMSDSKIVLHWLHKNTTQLKEFVANRVRFIQENSLVGNWHHIRTKLNPADCASRGIHASALIDHPLWWNGPCSQNFPITELQSLSDEEIVLMETEFKPLKARVIQAKLYSLQTYYLQDDKAITIDLLERFSSLGKLLRTTAYIWRFRKRYWKFRSHLHVKAEEMDTALNWHIRSEQIKFFSSEINQLQKSQCISPSSKIISLTPFIDAATGGILRVSGRLEHASIGDGRRYPIILPRESTLTKLIIRKTHYDTLHGGIQLMLNTLRENYWILQARTLIKRCIYECTVCRRHKHQMMTQRMASLPKARVAPTPPFAVSGLDYCGPFHIRIGSKNVRTVKKTFVAIFVCMATKAVHIELAEDLSSEAFINLFTRFVNRRGPCTDLHSDNGTAFVGGNRILKEDLAAWHGTHAQQHLANRGTTWHFIPPGAPHHGGLWEAAVKSAKKHLLRVVGTQSIYYDQLHTLLVHVEACLNSRPLIALHDTLDDSWALTPADFLIGRSIVAVPDKPVTNLPTNRLSYFRQLRQMQQHFWQKWHDEYLSTLQSRSKWQQPNDNLRIDDIVIVRHENLPATHWRIGKVIALHPGEDGLVRVATIKHSKGECTRPIQKLCRLLDKTELTRSAGQDV